ncbi:MAG: type II secretion system secretin GspD [Myxococcota bacterium]
MSTRMIRPTLQNRTLSPFGGGAARVLAILGVPALLALAIPGLSWAQDEPDAPKEDAPKQERIRPAAGPLIPGQLPNGPVLPGGPPPGAPTKGAEADKDAGGATPGGGATGAVTAKKVPCVEPSTKVTIDFVDAPLMDVTKYMAEITCRNFILGDKLEGQVTIISHQQVSVGEAYEAYLSALEVAGFTTVSVGGNTKIVATSKASNAPLRVYEGDNIPGTDNFVTQIIELDNVTVSDISTVVKELSGPSAKVIAYAPTNTLILTDAAYNIRRVYRIIKQMDVAAPRSHLEVIPIRFATAADVERILEEVYGVAAAASTTTAAAASTPAARRRGRAAEAEPAATSSATNVGSEGAFISKIIADERTNSLILMANDEAIAKVKELVAQVDVDIDPSSRSQIHVIYLDHANAEEVASVLTNLSQGTGGSSGSSRSTGTGTAAQRRSTTGGTGTQQRGGAGSFGGGAGGSQGGGNNFPRPFEPGGAVGSEGATSGVAAAFDSGAVRITADENTNSLVLLASPEDFRVIKSVIDRLDIPRRQVYVEAVVLEIGSEDNLDLGLSYHFGKPTADGGLMYGRTGFGDANSLSLSADALSGLAMGLLGAPISVVTQTAAGPVSLEIPAFGVAINALASNSAVNILSNPNILVLDNEEATISVGRNVPFPVSAGLDSNGNQIQSFQREDVGIVLQVTPQINENNYVTLEMSLEVAEVEEGTGSAEDGGFITSKRETENVVVVRDNQTIVIGGLIGSTTTEGETKVPILGDIPLLGVLFRGKKNVERKTNLLIFLTPHVINEPADLEEVYRVKVAQREEFLRRFYGKSREEQEEELQAILRGSMNLIDEPSMYRKKAPPKPIDSMIQDDGGLQPIDSPTGAPAPTRLPEPQPEPEREPTPDFNEGGE